MNELIDGKVNVWDVVDTYFRDEPYYKSQHQVDSFNEFVFSKENGIQHIIKRENPHQIFKGDTGDGNFKYQIQIYFGETFVDDEKRKGVNMTKTINYEVFYCCAQVNYRHFRPEQE